MGVATVQDRGGTSENPIPIGDSPVPWRVWDSPSVGPGDLTASGEGWPCANARSSVISAPKDHPHFYPQEYHYGRPLFLWSWP